MWNGTLRFLPTYLLGGYLGCDLFVNLIKEGIQLLRRIQSDEVAEVGGVETFLCGGAQPLEFGFVFQIALLIVFQIAMLIVFQIAMLKRCVSRTLRHSAK